jgi:tetratricopeptide (TPR) repeat protein
MRNPLRPQRLLLPTVAAGGILLLMPPAHAQAPVAPTTANAPAPPEPLFDGIGKYSRKITTTNPDTQRYFDQGLNFLFAFNHDESIRSFQRAAAADPNCAMAYWGIAIANGPHINFPFVLPDHAKAAVAAITRAQALAVDGKASDVERALIDAQAKRFTDPQPEDRRALDEAYAAAMRDVYRRFPNDADAGALFAEALMDLRPWDLWTLDGKPQPETPEIVSTLEAVLKQAPYHPQALHLYIHAMEASPNADKAVDAADKLRDLTPGLGHLVHMPSHIDIRTGQWQKAIAANERAIEVDRRYAAKTSRPPGFYRVYMAHNRHMLAFAALMQGESHRSLTAIREMLAGIPDDFKKENAAFIDGLYSMPYEVLTRFGRWNDILAEPEPPEYFPITRALWHAARGVAQAALGRTADARVSQAAFRAGVAVTPKEATFGNSSAAAVFAVADAMLDGEILLKEGKRAEGLAALRDGVAKEDQLRYDEPPDWILPVRHSLGAALLLSKSATDAAEAEAVYRADLKHWPENGWSLYGLSQSLIVQGKGSEGKQVQARFAQAWKHADVKLASSCFCQTAAR